MTVQVSFEMAEYTGNVDGLGTLRLLDALRTAGLGDTVRFYQASTRRVARAQPHRRRGSSCPPAC